MLAQRVDLFNIQRRDRALEMRVADRAIVVFRQVLLPVAECRQDRGQLALSEADGHGLVLLCRCRDCRSRVRTVGTGPPDRARATPHGASERPLNPQITAERSLNFAVALSELLFDQCLCVVLRRPGIPQGLRAALPTSTAPA